MTDLEITRLCAEAMSIPLRQIENDLWTDVDECVLYDPLHDDAQAMALVKTWPMPTTAAIRYGIMTHTGRWETFDVNRAIVECVAKKMQQAKEPRND